MAPYGLTINQVNSLQGSERIAYDNFINMIGNSNVVIVDIPSQTEDMYSFFRYFKFDHDSNFNIIGLTSYLKSYEDFTNEEKSVIDSFLQFISAYTN